jgi:hypothetical protein
MLRFVCSCHWCVVTSTTINSILIGSFCVPKKMHNFYYYIIIIHSYYTFIVHFAHRNNYCTRHPKSSFTNAHETLNDRSATFQLKMGSGIINDMFILTLDRFRIHASSKMTCLTHIWLCHTIFTSSVHIVFDVCDLWHLSIVIIVITFDEGKRFLGTVV